MSNLSGFDSEVSGFDCVSEKRRPTDAGGSQTTEFAQHGSASQTNTSKDIGCMAHPDDFNPELKNTPSGLNEFLQRVVPAMMEQLDQNDREFINYSSDSDEEEIITAKLLQEIQVKDTSGAGDHGNSVLGLTWSSGGNSLAFSIGAMQHEAWCENSGLIKIFSFKRSEDKFIHSLDLTEKDCVTVLKYHPTVPALLAYGTASGEVVLCDLRNGSMDTVPLSSPSGCHGSRRVSALQWADTALANRFLMMQITSKGKRRGAADQVLFSAGSDGTLNAWQLNPNHQIFENIICYTINGTQNLAPDITCFDFIKSYPLRPTEEKVSDIFVVGTVTGKLFLCKIKEGQGMVDPVYDVLEGHTTCVFDVAFSEQKPAIFVSISMDSELRMYDVNQPSPLKIICLDCPVSSMSWLSPPAVILGLSSGEESLRVYNVNTGKAVPVTGLSCGGVNCLAVDMHDGSCRVAGGGGGAGGGGAVRVWELPARRMKLTDDIEF